MIQKKMVFFLTLLFLFACSSFANAELTSTLTAPSNVVVTDAEFDVVAAIDASAGESINFFEVIVNFIASDLELLDVVFSEPTNTDFSLITTIADANVNGSVTLQYLRFDNPSLAPGTVATFKFRPLQVVTTTVGGTWKADDNAAPPNPFPSPSPGTYTDESIQIDSGPDNDPPVFDSIQVDGNASPATVDADAPPINLTVTATDADSNVASIEYSIDGGAFQAMTADTPPFDSPTESSTADITNDLLALGPGTYTITVRATDSSTNANSATDTFDVTFEAGLPSAISLIVNKRTINTNGTDTIGVTGTIVDASSIAIGAAAAGLDVIFTIDDDTYAVLPDNGDGALTETVTADANGEATVTITSSGTPVGAASGIFNLDATGTGGLVGFDGADPTQATTVVELTAQDRELQSITVAPQSPDAKVGGGDIQFTAEGTFDLGDPTDVTESVDWSIIAGGAYGTISNAPGTKGLFSPVAATPTGEVVTVQADPGIAGQEKTVSFTVAAADPLSLFDNCANVPAIFVNETFDLSNAVEGGVPGYTYEVLSGPSLVGVLPDSNFSPTIAGTYEIQVTDSQPVSTSCANVVVSMLFAPQTFTITEDGGDQNFTLTGAPAGSTITPTITDLSGGTAPTIVANGGSPNETLTLTPADVDAIQTFGISILAEETGSGFSQTIATGATAFTIIPVQSFDGVVTDASILGSPVDGATVTLLNTGDVQTSVADGTFSFAGLQQTGKEYTFSVTAAGFFPQTFGPFATWTNPVSFELQPDTSVGAITGLVNLNGDPAPYEVGTGTASVQVKKQDGTYILLGTDPLTVFVNPTTGAYSFPIPAGDETAGPFTIEARKAGYITPEETSGNSGIRTGVGLDGSNNAFSPDADVSLQPVTRISVDAVAEPDSTGNVILQITAQGAPGQAFDGSAGEIAVTDSGGNPVTLTANLPAYEWTAPYGNLSFTIQADVSDDRDVANAYAATRDYCYLASVDTVLPAVLVETNVIADAVTRDTVFNPNANGGTVTSNSSDTMVTIPIGGVAGVNRTINRLTVIVTEALAAEVGAPLIVGSTKIHQVEFFDDNRDPLPTAEIVGVQISLPYDTTAITAEQLLSGVVPIYTAATGCEMAGATSLAIVPAAQVISAANGVVTFEVTSSGAYGVAGATLMPPTITALIPSSNVSTAGQDVRIQGMNLATVGTVEVSISGGAFTVTAFNYDVVAGEIIFQAPTAANGSTGTVRITNPSGTASRSYSYAGGVIPNPNPNPTPIFPNAGFFVENFEDADVVEITAGTVLQFRDDSTNAFTYSWNFGDEDSEDDNTSALRNPEHAYNAPGTYDVVLRASNTAGISVERKLEFIVVSPLEATFTVEPGEGTVPVEVTVTDTTTVVTGDEDTSTVTGREWVLTGPDGQDVVVGNGAESFALTLTDEGSYTLALTVENNEATDTTQQSFTFEGTTPTELRADFNFDVDGCNVTFTNESEGPFAVSLWDFGDGTFSDEASPVHSYAGNGSFNVSLAIATADGAVDDSISQTVNIVNCGTIVPTINAGFTATPTSGDFPLAVQFTDTSVSDPVGLLDTWTWNFGDGGTSTAQNPSHTYEAEGTYTATLVASISGTAISGQAAPVEITVTDGTTDPALVVNPPVGQQPADGSTGVGLNPTLVIGPYDDSSNAYGSTQWQIAVDPSFAEMFLIWDQIKDDGTADDFMLAIPDFILEAGPGTYYWRTRFIDANGLPSVWAGPYVFTTVAVDPDDQNGNGVPDDQEVDDPTAVFPGLDPANPLILFVRSAMGDGYWALEGVENVADLISLRAYTIGEAGVSLPPNTEVPLGLMGFKLQTLNPGDEAKVRVYFNPAAPENAAWFAFLGVQGWQEFSGSTAVFDGGMASVMLTLQDGGFGDLDGIENGIIIIPLSGYGVVTSVIVEDGGSGSDTCFISAATEKPWAALVLMTLVAAAGFALRRTPLR